MLSFLFALALSAGPALAQGGFLGVSIADPATDDRPGAVIQDVQIRSAAHFLGLQAGDVVTAVDGAAVDSASAFARRVAARLPGSVIDLTVSRDGMESVMSGVVGRRPGASSGVGGPFAPELAPRFQDVPPLQPLRIGPGEWDAEMQRLQQRLDELNRELNRELQGMDLRMPGVEGFTIPEFPVLPRMDLGLPGFDLSIPEFHIDGLARAGEGAKVHIRYPADTPEEDRQRLLDEAVENYGEDVQVEFEGRGTMIRIEQRRTTPAPAPRPQRPSRSAPSEGGDVEEL